MAELSKLRAPIHMAHPEALTAIGVAVTFMIGTQEYGLLVADVVEIVPIPALLILVGAPAHVVGLLNRRGRYLPVLDGRILVGEPAHYDLDRYVIIAGRASASGEQLVPLLGMVVDQVCDVRVFEAEHVTPLGIGAAARCLDGVVRLAEHSVLLFSLEELLVLTPSVSLEVTHP